MKYFMVTAKCGHVGKNNYYKGTMFVQADNGREAAQIVRNSPRVKHDQKDAILDVQEINDFFFDVGNQLNKKLHYYSCENIQEQRQYLEEIENNIFVEDWITEEPKRYTKKHTLRNTYNWDPEYESYKQNKYKNYYVA